MNSNNSNGDTACQEFRYPTMGGVIFFGFIAFSIFIVLMFMFLNKLIQDSNSEDIPVFIIAGLAGYLVFYFGYWKAIYKRYRPIALNSEGVSTLVLGSISETIKWVDIKQIVRTRMVLLTEYYTAKYGHEFKIIGSKNEIRFDDKIADLSSILNTLNLYVDLYKIPIVGLDIGDDVRNDVRNKIHDIEERNRLIKHGVPVAIYSLSDADPPVDWDVVVARTPGSARKQDTAGTPGSGRGLDS